MHYLLDNNPNVVIASSMMSRPNDDFATATCLKRRYYPWQQRRKKFCMVDNHNDNDEDDEFRTIHDYSAGSISTRRRPWASSQILSSTIVSNSQSFVTKSPFLQGFYQEVGIPLPSSAAAAAAFHGLNNQKQDDTTVEDLDNSAFSTLTPAQHRRYLKLVQLTERRTPSERAYWKQLLTLVPTEQAQYHLAVQKFWAHHKHDRLLLGLSSSSSRLRAYCQWACTANLEHNERLLQQLLLSQHGNNEQQPFTKFGKCRQVLSLRPDAALTEVDVTDLDIHIVMLDNDNDDNDNDKNRIPVVSELPAVGSLVPVPVRAAAATTTTKHLQNDSKALQLAQEHQADMITTDTCLEALLAIPGDATTRWLLPAVMIQTIGKKNVMVLQAPLAQAYTTPRACLTRGIQQGLHLQAAAAASIVESQDSFAPTTSPAQQQYAYTLWTIPNSTTGGRRESLRVLIRSEVRLLWKLPDASTVPLRLRAHVDYFPERGQELPCRYERSLWILDQLLMQQPNTARPNVATRVCRVSGQTGKILEWQEASVAHAFAAVSIDDSNPMQGIWQCIQFFRAVSTIDFTKTSSCVLQSCRLLCLPGRGGEMAPKQHLDPYSVSVHAPSDDEQVVDLGVLLQDADGVLLNATAIQECYRPWKWDIPDRIPYTFPTAAAAATGKADTGRATKKKKSK